MSSVERAELKSAERQLRAVAATLQKAAAAIEVKEEPALRSVLHVGSWHLAEKPGGPSDSEARRRREEITLVREEVEDLCGRIAVLRAT